jgi:hypothetical protein
MQKPLVQVLEQHWAGLEQLVPKALQLVVTHIPPVQVVIPEVKQHSEVWVQLWPDVAQAAAQSPPEQLLEQQALAELQVMPLPAQAPCGPQAPPVQMAEQHCAAAVHALPFE